MKVKEVMSAHSVKFCTPETNLIEAVKSMKEGNCGALPVVNQEYKVLGIVTYRDICLTLAEPKTQPWEQRKVGDIMTKNVQTVSSEDEVSTAIQNLRKNQIGRLPVVDSKGKLSGIVSLHNLIDLSVNQGKKELWEIKSQGESLLKTVRAVTGRYSVDSPTSPSNFVGE